MNEEYTAYYLNNFFGYGNWQSNFWFIGMEEGGGHSENLVINKINSFFLNHKSHLALVDNYDFQITCVGQPWNEEAIKFLGPRPNNKPVKLQSYWAKKIKILLHCHGQNTDNESIRNFQANNWGRINLEQMQHAIIELLPLPSPGTDDWFYDEWTAHFTGAHCPQLENRIFYKEHIINDRISLLIHKINQFNPRVIVLSGYSYNDYYNTISGTNDWEILNFNNFNCAFTKVNYTLFVKVLAPNTRGLTNEYWNLVSNEISERLINHH
jgi:hypothetical protein